MCYITVIFTFYGLILHYRKVYEYVVLFESGEIPSKIRLAFFNTNAQGQCQGRCLGSRSGLMFSPVFKGNVIVYVQGQC